MLAPPETSCLEIGSSLRNLPDERIPASPLRDSLDRDSLDPSDWHEFREQAHRMLDDILDYTEYIRERPVWQPIPRPVRAGFRQSLPQAPAELAVPHGTVMRQILPYSAGNAHPGFMGWVHGGGTPGCILAERLPAGLNANLVGRDHI